MGFCIFVEKSVPMLLLSSEFVMLNAKISLDGAPKLFLRNRFLRLLESENQVTSLEVAYMKASRQG